MIKAHSEALDILVREEDRFAVHAGAGETSGMLYLRPELVQPAFRQAKPQAGEDWSALVRLARERGAPVVAGGRMLLYQGVLAQKLWTGREPNVKAMDLAIS